MGSSGLWDMIHWADAAESIRRVAIDDAASRAVGLAMLENNWSLRRDTTALALDVLLPDGEDFPKVVKAKLRRKRLKGRQAFGFCRDHLCPLKGLKSVQQGGAGWSYDDAQIVANIDGWVFLEAEQQAQARADRRRSAGYAYPEREWRQRRSSAEKRSAESSCRLCSCLTVPSGAPGGPEGTGRGRGPCCFNCSRRTHPQGGLLELMGRGSPEEQALYHERYSGGWPLTAQPGGASEEAGRRHSVGGTYQGWLPARSPAILPAKTAYPVGNAASESRPTGERSGQRVAFTMRPCQET
eukprot:evm.model.scf_3526.1 EVM.evm.TU.scf_3526.1   scf_3526:1803-2693(-)